MIQERVDEWTNETRMDEWMNEGTDGWTDGAAAGRLQGDDPRHVGGRGPEVEARQRRWLSRASAAACVCIQ